MRGSLSRLHTLLQSFHACATADAHFPELFEPPLRRGNEPGQTVPGVRNA